MFKYFIRGFKVIAGRAKFRCRSCSKSFSLNLRKFDFFEKDNKVSCPHCHKSKKCSFTGFCQHCDEFTGFMSPHVIEDVAFLARGFLEGFTHSPKVFSRLKFAFDTKPYGLVGKCSCCNTVNTICPHCRKILSVTDYKITDNMVIVCKSCQKNFNL